MASLETSHIPGNGSHLFSSICKKKKQKKKKQKKKTSKLKKCIFKKKIASMLKNASQCLLM